MMKLLTLFLHGAACLLLAIPQQSGPGVEELVELLKSPDPEVRRQSLNALLQLGPENCRESPNTQLVQVGVPAIAALLQDSDISTAEYAADVLGELGFAARGAAPALEHALRDERKAVRVAAASALARVNPEEADLITRILIEELEIGHFYVAEALMHLGYLAKPAVPSLAKGLSHSDIEVVRSVALALGNMGPAAEAAVPELFDAIQNDDASVRWYALRALARCGSVPREYVPTLERLTEDEQETVRREAFVALWFATKGEDVPIGNLLRAARHSNPDIRVAAIHALGAMWHLSEDARQAVEAALSDPDEDVALVAYESWRCH